MSCIHNRRWKQDRVLKAKRRRAPKAKARRILVVNELRLDREFERMIKRKVFHLSQLHTSGLFSTGVRGGKGGTL